MFTGPTKPRWTWLDSLRFLLRRLGRCRSVLIMIYRERQGGYPPPLRIIPGDIAMLAAVLG